MNDRRFSDRRADSRSCIGGQTEAMQRAIEDEAPENVLHVDVDAWAEALADHYAIAVPVLHPKRIRQSAPQQTKIPGPWGYDGRQRSDPAIRYTVHVPFEGERDVFKYGPSTWTTSGRPFAHRDLRAHPRMTRRSDKPGRRSPARARPATSTR